MRPRLLGSVAAAAVVSAIGIAGPAWSTTLHYVGTGPGTVTCRATINVKFKPAITDANAATVTRIVRGGLSLCAASDARVTAKKGIVKIFGTAPYLDPFRDSPLVCGGSSTGGNLSISWKGKFDGTFDNQTFHGHAVYSPTLLSISTSETTDPFGFAGLHLTGGSNQWSGSFVPAGDPNGLDATLYNTHYTPAQITSLCAGKGIHALHLVGTMSIG